DQEQHDDDEHDDHPGATAGLAERGQSHSAAQAATEATARPRLSATILDATAALDLLPAHGVEPNRTYWRDERARPPLRGKTGLGERTARPGEVRRGPALERLHRRRA